MCSMLSFDVPKKAEGSAVSEVVRFPRRIVHLRHPTKRAKAPKIVRFDEALDDNFNIFAVEPEVQATKRAEVMPSRPPSVRIQKHDADRLARLNQRRSRVRTILDKSPRRHQMGLESDSRRLADLRPNFWVAELENRPTPALRLAVHAINFSVAFVALPVGAAMTTYPFLRGEDMRITSRLTTMSSLALVALQTNPGVAHALGF